MNAKTDSNSTRPLEDPRCRPDFQPQFYPKANGKEAPSTDAQSQNDRLVLEFLNAYYDLNLAHARLLKAREASVSPQRKEAERICLQDVEKFLINRDSLEDKFAPLGVIAEPVHANGFTVNVLFSFGNVDAWGQRRSDWFTITTSVPIPFPSEVKFEDLPIQIEGPGINPE